MENVSNSFNSFLSWVSGQWKQVKADPLSWRSLATYGVVGSSLVCATVYLQFRRHHANAHLQSAVRPFTPFRPEHSGDIEYLTVPDPGEISMADYTIPSIFEHNDDSKSDGSSAGVAEAMAGDLGDELTVITWNIERGYKLQEIIDELRKHNADIILLQEVDIGCIRTGERNVASEIAYALRMRVVYTAESWHINERFENEPPPKGWTLEFDEPPPNGCEGNAILTKWDILNAYSFSMPCVRNSYMPEHSEQKRHSVPVAHIMTPQCGEVVVYSVHMDAFAGRSKRVTQYAAVFVDAVQQHYTSKDDNTNPAIIIGGDFNSHSHGIARFSSALCGDCPLRFRHWGQSEAEWWLQNVIGFERRYVASFYGRKLRLKDPFATRDVTVSKRVCGFTVWSGKVDWLLFGLDKLYCTHKHVSVDCDASDHQFLLCKYKVLNRDKY